MKSDVQVNAGKLVIAIKAVASSCYLYIWHHIAKKRKLGSLNTHLYKALKIIFLLNLHPGVYPVVVRQNTNSDIALLHTWEWWFSWRRALGQLFELKAELTCFFKWNPTFISKNDKPWLFTWVLAFSWEVVK